MLNHVIVKDFGPIIFVDIELQRFTFFIGQQGSGKSTVAKIVSYCSWIEKEFSTTLSNEYFATKEMFMNRLMEFHKLAGYCKPTTEIYYETDFVQVEYSASTFNVELKNKYEYKKAKILYVPAERNLAVMSEFEKVNLGNNSLRSFLFDWFEARKRYSRKQNLDILDSGISFFSEESSGVRQNKLMHKNGSSFEISLSDASSGMQSFVPLEVVIDYFTSAYYDEKDNLDISFFYKEKQQKIYTSLLKELVLDNKNIETEESFEKISAWLKGIANGKEAENDRIIEIFDNLMFAHSTQFIVEEPEQNLYPTTQKAFLAFLIASCNADNRKHSCLITTHSPFLLNYLTLFVKASMIVNKCEYERARLEEIVPLDSVVYPEEFEIYEFFDGTVRKLSKPNNMPSDENLLNLLLEKTNLDFSEMLEMEDLCQQ